MATKCEMWKSSDGNVFDNEYEAVRDDLIALLRNTQDALPAPGDDVSRVADKIIGDYSALTKLRDSATRLVALHPLKPASSSKCPHGKPLDIVCDHCIAAAAPVDQPFKQHKRGIPWANPDSLGARLEGK